MAEQRWKTDESLYGAPTEKTGEQIKKTLDYDTIYRKEFLNCDPLRDWESIDRCIWLWQWSLEIIGDTIPVEELVDTSNWNVLDIGTKDAQFPEWLRQNSVMSMGLEYSQPYVEYALNKGRPIQYGNACEMEFEDNVWDYVFAHHVHGLLPDYLVGLQEMFRVSRRYMIALNQVPGNKKKHYSYIDSPQIYHDFAESVDCRVLYNDFLDTGFSNEWVIFLEKNAGEVGHANIEVLDGEVEQQFKQKKENPFF